MPRREHDAVVAVGLKEHLIGAARVRLTRLVNAESDWYDFEGDRRRERERLGRLLEGRSLVVYRHEIPAQFQPPRDGQHVFTLTRNRLVQFVRCCEKGNSDRQRTEEQQASEDENPDV